MLIALGREASFFNVRRTLLSPRQPRGNRPCHANLQRYHRRALLFPWNKGKLSGQKRPFTLRQIWEIRIRLQFAGRVRGCDLVRLRVNDVTHGDQVLTRAKALQQKIGRPVSFELTDETRGMVHAWIGEAGLPGLTSCSSVEFSEIVTSRCASMHVSSMAGSA
jgi:integrase